MTLRFKFALTLSILILVSCSQPEATGKDSPKKYSEYAPLELSGNEIISREDLKTTDHYNKVQRYLDSHGIIFDRFGVTKIVFDKPIDINTLLEITYSAEEEARASKQAYMESHAITDPSQVKALRLSAEGKHEEALNILLPLAKKGDIKAAAAVAMVYMDAKKCDEAIEWNEVAAKGGFISAMMGQYVLLSEDDCGHKDLQRAVYWLEQSADAGDKLAIDLIYDMYSTGTKEFPADEAKANYWREKLRTN